MKRILYVLISWTLMFFISCGKEESDYVIPRYPVNFSINLNTSDNHLTGAGNMIFYVDPRETNISEEYRQAINSFSSTRLVFRAMAGEYLGYSGLVVVNTGNSFIPYDLCCSYEEQKNIRVIPTKETFHVKCPKCGSVFDLYSGGRAISGSATTKGKRLQHYNIYPTGENKFRISN